MNWLTLSILLLGGLAVFLHGMTVMTDGLKAAAGNNMKNFLQKMTKNRWTSLLAGTGITAVIQSSSVTTVLAVGFVSAGLLTFQSTLGVILGANIGTTITAQIIAFKITKASWLMVAVGYLVSVLLSNKTLREIGTIVMGLGLVFLGMNVMSEATEPLKTYQPFILWMEGLDNHFLGIIVGLIFTAAVQSSSATTGVVIVLATQGLLSVDGGIAIILGANVGTCVTAILSALGKPRDAMRVAFSHVFFNLAGVLLWFAFISQLHQIAASISPGSPARQIANAHTLFNVANTIIFIWMVKPVSKLVLWLLPDRKKPEKMLYPELHSFYLEDTAMALEISKNAIVKLGNRTLKIIEKGWNIALYGTATELNSLRQKDIAVDKGQAEILQFLKKILEIKVTGVQVAELNKQIEAVNVLETAADLITTHLVEAAEHRVEKQLEMSEATIAKLSELYRVSQNAFDKALQDFTNSSPPQNSVSEKEAFKLQLQEVRSYLAQRLISVNDDKRITIYRFESELLEAIRRLHSLARRLERKAG